MTKRCCSAKCSTCSSTARAADGDPATTRQVEARTHPDLAVLTTAYKAAVERRNVEFARLAGGKPDQGWLDEVVASDVSRSVSPKLWQSG